MAVLLLDTFNNPREYRTLVESGLWPNYGVFKRTPITTAGTDTTLTTAQLLSGAIILAAGASGGFTITLPSTASIIADLGQCKKDGTYSMWLLIKNNGVGQTGTLTPGDGSTTITGTATIATNTTRTFLITVSSGTALQIDNFGSMSL